MKPPPLLLGATLLFWGWQSDLLPVGALLAVVLESARVIHRRWDFSNEDFARIWTLCSLLFLGSAIYAFTVNEGPAAFSGYLENPSFANQRSAGGASAKTAAAMFRWLPMIFFPFMAASTFSTRAAIPLTTISLVMRRRWRKAKAAGLPVPRDRDVQVGYPYLVATLLASSVHPATDNTFFWGLALLMTWALLALRPRRFHFTLWATTLGVVLTLGFFGQTGIGQLQSYLERLNPAWLQRFLQRNPDPSRSRTAIGRIGQLKLSGKIVIRVQPHADHPAPEYLREATYRAYRSGTWFASGRRESFDGNIGEEYPNSRSWQLVPGRKSNSVAQISCAVPGGVALLPLPTGSWRLENLAAYVLQKNDLGSVLCQGPGLVIFDAHYGPGDTLDSPPLRDDRMNVPPEEQGALKQIAVQLGLNSEMPTREAMRRVQTFFTDDFTYSTWQEIPRGPRTNSLTPLGRFLLQNRTGHCEYFATATTLLLRTAGIPARYAVGYYVHEHSGQKYVVRLRDAHAWCVVWDEQAQQWVNFDTTPASWVKEEARLQSAFQWLNDLWTRITFELAKFRWGQSRVREYLFLLIVPGLLVLAYQIFFRRHRRQPRGADDADADRVWPGLDSEFYRLEAALAARGFPRAPAEPLTAWLERATESAALADLRTPLRQLLRLHYRHRFDPAGLTNAERDALRAEARVCLEHLAQLEAQTAAGK